MRSVARAHDVRLFTVQWWCRRAGDLPLDVSIDIEPLDLAWAKLQLDTRRNALESSALTPGRTVALEQTLSCVWRTSDVGRYQRA